MTALAQQLAKLSTGPVKSDKFAPSILFDIREAARHDLDAIYTLGLKGFEELVKMNSRAFQPFRADLFSEASKMNDREKLARCTW
jgi:hypothetical protein